MRHLRIVMATVTWISAWAVSADVNVHVQLVGDSEATLSSLPLHLTRPEGDVSVPCQLSLLWTQRSLRCTQLQLEVRCSARHIELYVEGTRRNLLGEEEQGEVYLGTFRGTKQSSEPQLFSMSPIIKSDGDCDVLQRLQTLRIKFVSLMGDKNVLNLQELRCIFVSSEPVVAADSSTAGLTAKVASDNVADMQMLLKSFQQTMEREMETKIARAIDAKLATLAQRLSLSEQALFHLHKKMDTKNVPIQDSLNQIQQKFLQLEDQLSQFSIAKAAEQKNNDDLG